MPLVRQATPYTCGVAATMSILAYWKAEDWNEGWLAELLHADPVCMYVCLYVPVCMYACMYAVCMYAVCMYVCMSVCCMYVPVCFFYVCFYTGMYVCV